MSVAPTGTVSRATKYQRGSKRASAHSAPGKINNALATSQRCSDNECADTDAEQTSQESVQWQAVRQDVSFCDRR
jgi:hypothetical protein